MLDVCRVLLVEDDHTLGEMYAAAMRKRGLTVDHAHSLASARVIVSQVRPAIACVDGRLPDGLGVDLAESLMAMGARVIILTNDQELHDNPPAGVDVAMIKALLSPQALASAIHKMLLEPGR